MSSDLLLQLALLTAHGRGLGIPVNFARQEHAPRDDEEFPGNAMIVLRGPALLRLTDIELSEGAGVPPGEGVGGLDEECVRSCGAARLADAALETLIARLDDRRVETGIDIRVRLEKRDR